MAKKLVLDFTVKHARDGVKEIYYQQSGSSFVYSRDNRDPDLYPFLAKAPRVRITFELPPFAAVTKPQPKAARKEISKRLKTATTR